MKINYADLWNSFKINLIESLKESSEFELSNLGNICDRTSFYFKVLLPRVAQKMGLMFTTEEPFRVDGMFYKIGRQDGNNLKIPIILLESENDYTTSEGEVKKLCLLNAPLKILVVCSEWAGSISKDIVEGYWEYIMEDFASDSASTGYFAFINCSCTPNIRFDALVYDENVLCLGEEKLFVN